jgi:hypothetical protein
MGGRGKEEGGEKKEEGCGKRIPSPLEGEGQGGGASSEESFFKRTPHPTLPLKGGGL